jgi:phasin
MAEEPERPFEIPEAMRETARRSVEDAQAAFDRFISATQEAVGRLDARSETAQTGLQEISRKMLELSEENVKAAFDHAQRLLRARTLDDVVKLQSEFTRRQMAMLGEQTRVLSDATQKVGDDIGKE